MAGSIHCDAIHILNRPIIVSGENFPARPLGDNQTPTDGTSMADGVVTAIQTVGRTLPS